MKRRAFLGSVAAAVGGAVAQMACLASGNANSRALVPNRKVEANSSIHLRFDCDKSVFCWSERNDGLIPRSLAVTPVHGGSVKKLSPFVTLTAR